MARRPRPQLKPPEDPVAFVAKRLEARRPPGPFKEGAFSARLHDERVTARLGLALAVSFLTCFGTGLISHFHQDPWTIGFLSSPASPVWFYRITQGVHVTAGIASIPLLLFKLWTVYPLLFTWPPARNTVHATERAFVGPLVALAIFQLVSGLINTMRWYPWEFNFRITHYWAAWMVIGVLVIHIGAKWHQTRRALKTKLETGDDEPTPEGAMSRRGLLVTAAAAVGAVTVTTVGQTFRPLKELAALSPRIPDVGPQGFPVNRTAKAAGVLETARAPTWRLEVSGAVRNRLDLSLAELRSLPQTERELPITCVEGWSAGAVWRGIRLRDVLELAGAPEGATVSVSSLQTSGSFGSSEVNSIVAHADDTLLAFEVNGETLHIDHGYPCRLIAPNRPGVQQTKWINKLEVKS